MAIPKSRSDATKLLAQGFNPEKTLWKCDHFKVGVCPETCKYAHTFLFGHVLRFWSDYAGMLLERTSKRYPFGYVKSTSCQLHRLIRLETVK